MEKIFVFVLGLRETVSPARDADCDWALDRTHVVPQRSEGLEAQRSCAGGLSQIMVNESGKQRRCYALRSERLYGVLRENISLNNSLSRRQQNN
jgi:hypothetical protein